MEFLTYETKFEQVTDNVLMEITLKTVPFSSFQPSVGFHTETAI